MKPFQQTTIKRFNSGFLHRTGNAGCPTFKRAISNRSMEADGDNRRNLETLKHRKINSTPLMK
jgi:hypothetical protein